MGGIVEEKVGERDSSLGILMKEDSNKNSLNMGPIANYMVNGMSLLTT